MSRRAITVWKIDMGSNRCPRLVAKCHLRKSTRPFRIDRITAFIDYDGEVCDCPVQFLIDNFGMSAELASIATTDGARLIENRHRKKHNKIRKLIRGQANLLAALSRSDGLMHDAEIGVMLDHCAEQCEQAGIILEDEDLSAIKEYVRRLRPDEHVALDFLDEVMASGADEINRLLLSSIKLIRADDVLHDAEIEMLNSFSEDLTGIAMF